MTLAEPEPLVDAVVVGSGATGGVAAMVLASAGLKVLVLDAGPALSARQAFGSEPLNSLKRVANISSGRQWQQVQHPGYWKANPDLYVDERQNPYSTPPIALSSGAGGVRWAAKASPGAALPCASPTTSSRRASGMAMARPGRFATPTWPLTTADSSASTACMATATACPNCRMGSFSRRCHSRRRSATSSRPSAGSWICR